MEQLKLNDLCFITKLAGFEYTKYFSGNFQESGIPLIQGKNIKNYSLDLSGVHYISEELSDSLPRSQVDNNSLLFCYVCNIADCWINTKNLKLHLGSNVAKINVIDKRLDPKYLFYWFQSPIHKNYIVQIAKGSAQKNINMEEIRNIDIVLPDLLAQQHIVNTIGSVDDLIENYQQEIDKICELLDKSLLQYPNRVEISSYNPKIIKSGIDSFFDSKEYLDTSSVEGVNNISAGEEITISKRPSRANMQPVKNSVWFAKMKGSYKKLIITTDDFDLTDHYILSTGFQGLLATKELPLSLLSAFVISKDFDVQRDLHSVGTTMAGINNETFMKMLVPQLSIQEIEEFDKKYSPLVKLLSKRRKEIAKLKTIKQQLLQKYF